MAEGTVKKGRDYNSVNNRNLQTHYEVNLGQSAILNLIAHYLKLLFEFVNFCYIE
jgi:hypothetical protein